MSLKSCEKVETNVYALEISFEGDAFKAAVTKAYTKNRGKYNVPGFRKGKAPKHIIETYYGKEVFWYDAIDAEYPELFDAAAKEAGIKLDDVEETGTTFSSSSDTEVIVKLIARGYKKGLERTLTDTIQMIKGSFALCVMTKDSLIGARDPNGIRPLCLGQVEGGWVLASESCAIDAMNGTFVRDVRPGEIVIINKDGVLSFDFGEKTSKRSCIFEYVYFARPDSIVDEIPVQEARYHLGAKLAEESPVEADVVVGVPDSGLGAAIGYSRATGIPYAMGVVKNKYIGRTFIAPTQKERERLVFVKLNAMKSDLDGKRVVVIDDSIVRGTTSRRLIQILRRAGAKEVHVRISSPPFLHPCYYGTDIDSEEHLIACKYSIPEICDLIGADSLGYLPVESLSTLTGNSGFCSACFNGNYPTRVPTDTRKDRFEMRLSDRKKEV